MEDVERQRSRDDYKIRRAVHTTELRQAREVLRSAIGEDLDYLPESHRDLEWLREHYVDNPRQALFVAVHETDGVVGTAEVRIGGPEHPPNPAWLAERYQDRQHIAQIPRVATLAEHRRGGLAHRLVAACQDFAAQDGGFRVIYLHARTKVAEAEPFCRSLPVREIHDSRSDLDDPHFDTVHFEMPLSPRMQVPQRQETSTGSVDWQQWSRRWDAQQSGYVADRETVFSFMFDVVERLDAAPGRLLDLACGTGSLADRALARFPRAEVVALDVDPFLMQLGRRTLGDTVQWVEADLRDDDWAAAIDGPRFDAVCSATALHWIDPENIERLARVMADRLREGGVFLSYDSLRLGPQDRPRLDTLASNLRHERAALNHAAGHEQWSAFWDAAASEPEFTELLAERHRRFDDRGKSSGLTKETMVDAFTAAGFAEVGVLHQVAERQLLVAIR